MPGKQILKIKGLFTSVNQLSAAPEGALEVAKNIDILSQDMAQPRRGFEKANSIQYTDLDDRTDRLWFYNDIMFSHHGTFLSADTLSYFDGGVWNTAGSFSAPDNSRIKTVEANQNLYFTSSIGMRKLDTYSATPEAAGVDKALNMEASLVNTGGWFIADATDDQKVAYRCVWAKYDDNDNLVEGAPSGRVIITNTAGSGVNYDVELTVLIPDNITTSHFCRIFRSATMDSPTALPVEPNDELQLIHEFTPSSSEITASEAVITDITPESLRGADLYTNATQQGLAASNQKPPLSKDIASFRGSIFFSDTISQHRYFLTLLSASAITVDDTLTIGGVAYTAKSTEDYTAGEFKIFTAGSTSQNIADTALSLVAVINKYSSSTVYAYYQSTNSSLPGKILLEERGIGGAAFTINASDSSYWSPSNIPSSGSAESSTNDAFQNQLIWSKPDEPEHVPLVNFQKVGSENEAILRIVPLEDALIIFKEDGIFRLTNHYPNFQLDRLDSSATLIGSETPAIVNNEIYCLTDLGVCKVNADGVQIISVSINQQLIQLINVTNNIVGDIAYGQGYETDKKYYLFLPNNSSDTAATFAYVFNILTNAWTTHEFGATASTIYNKSLYFGKSLSELILKERKNYSYLDYVDYLFSTSITDITDLTVTLNSGVDNVTVGDIVFQSNTIFSTVVATNTINSTITIDRDVGLSVASCDILGGIPTEVKWSVVADPTPGVIKQFHTAQIFFQEAFNGEATIGFSTDVSPGVSNVPLTGVENGNWGLSAWGATTWGSIPQNRPWRQWIPRNKQRCSQMSVNFKHRYGYSPWKLTGVALLANAGSEKIRKD